jgi:DNA invertase Pin-like site-specific DNA recombinase
VLVAARLDRITRRAHTLSQLLKDGVSIRAADMPGADDLMMRIYAAMAQKERELISERTKAALAAAKARGMVLGGDNRPVRGPDAAAASNTRRLEAERAGHRLALELEALRAEGIVSHAGMARARSERQITTPRGSTAWTHTTVARILAGRLNGACGGDGQIDPKRTSRCLMACRTTSGRSPRPCHPPASPAAPH